MTRTVIVILKPFRLAQVIDALAGTVTRLQQTEVRGYGRQRGNLDAYQDTSVSTEFIPKIRLEFDVSEEHLQTAIDRVCDVARTGRIGDGKIFVFPTVARVSV